MLIANIALNFAPRRFGVVENDLTSMFEGLVALLEKLSYEVMS